MTLDENALNLLTIAGLSLVAAGLGMLLKPLEVLWFFLGYFLKPLGITDTSVLQPTVLTLGKIFVLVGAIVLLLNLLPNLMNDKTDNDL
ncbi:hypothetical protein Desaci_4137 [Desulfosporosinus acidiphilus SJ4]|uniref:Uncharacterized protein n=1 Tax=Desulfosporosinus acidiphilus (strain DSM 22704 / JCM 16185 / SJ4) TaxID=646529 RepID=I4DB25_DESAJ|nr:hypothetical protein [Desulfosporosinus acidiphilus]AFM42999.1 hypothetical protein Desaci_4137 [Desulfosporosinus acidiphilus SJ4]